MLAAFCVANKYAEQLFFFSYDENTKKDVFDPFFQELNSYSIGDPPPILKRNNKTFIYILRNDLYWMCTLIQDNLLELCGPLVVLECLSQIHCTCEALIGTITQNSISVNSVLIYEIILENMPNGLMQPQDSEKIQLQLYSNVNNPRETFASNITSGLFGLERTAPSNASKKSLLTVSSSKREVFVDVVEKIWATVGTGGAVVRYEVNGEITLHCFLPESPSVSIKLNTDLSQTSHPGFSADVKMCNIEYGSCVSYLKDQESIPTLNVDPKHGETVILRYSLPTDNQHLLPFSLSATTEYLTESDAELKMKLVSTTNMGTMAPQVTIKIQAPPNTTSVMSRTSGLKHQTVSFTPQDKKIVWQIKSFPGGSYGQAFLRLVDAGGNVKIENGQMEFEVSHWTCSGLRVENVKLEPPIANIKKWVRYLTSSDSVYLNFK